MFKIFKYFSIESRFKRFIKKYHKKFHKLEKKIKTKNFKNAFNIKDKLIQEATNDSNLEFPIKDKYENEDKIIAKALKNKNTKKIIKNLKKNN